MTIEREVIDETDFDVLSMRENKSKADRVVDETKCKTNFPITVITMYSLISNNLFLCESPLWYGKNTF